MDKPGYRLLRILCAAWLVAAALAGCDRTPAGPETTPAQLDAGMVNPGYQEKPAWFTSSFLDLREDVAEAESGGKRVLLYFYQDGCPYCKKLLEVNFARADIVRYTRAHFEVIAINLWGDREVTDLQGRPTTEKALARDLRVMFTPTLLFLDGQGGVVLRLNGYYPPPRFLAALQYSARYSGDKPGFREYLAQVSPEPSAGALPRDSTFLPPDTDLAARHSGRPLLVLFEQQDCATCDELHADVLQHPEARAQLARFDVMVLDMWSQDPVKRPDGRTGSGAEWARELDVKYAPSLVFFDADNREVFRTEAWLRTFHTVSAMDYVASRAYLEYPEFQRYISARAERLEAQGRHIDLME
jgi:thioredoxin-related protein